ncbi:linear gramicidin synthase subunit C [Methylobacterium phyllosphaerae]|uniref:Linear gramicidin synthase subunit C n=3 Tax=Methylobacterium phyllosphaerae TaxID=418223 RepID=A0ABM6FY90_9HYPH|nr:linear gramicidin synthase subunit C [Methylobacterium phyllosphaerae]
MLPLIELTQADIERIVAGVPGGVGNVQDIYSLSPLQDGILFHHLLASDGDPYLQASQMAFPDRALLDRYLAAVQRVVDRHDILRTAFVWDQLSVPAQVVWRKAPLVVTEVELDPHGGPGPEQMARRFDPRHFRIDLTQAPLLRYAIAREPGTERWLLHELQHHLVDDASSMFIFRLEVEAFLSGRGAELAPPRPYRDLIAQARLGIPQEEHERFFRSMLADIDEPTAPFGLLDVRRDGTAVQEARWDLPPGLNDQLRAQARRLGVSLASLCHLAWGQVIARTSGREQVVFGTVLFGRMRAGDGADQAMGLFINTLPLRLDLGDVDVETSVRQTHARLADLLRHEHGSLALAQRCSAVAAPTPLFSALLNYRHNVAAPAVEDRSHALAGIEWLGGEERTNYPFILSVEDYGHALGLTAQVVQPLSPDRVCALMRRSLESLVEALEHAPTTPVRRLDVLPRAERELLLETWNRTEAAYPSELCVHQLFEEQVRRSPDATALVQDEVSLSYGELNRRANRLAHHLIGLGVRPDERVAICLERSPAMVVGLLAILKAGGAYVPLDPAYPSERLGRILADAGPRLLLTDGVGRAVLGEACSGHTVLALDRPLPGEAGLPEGDPDPAELGLTAGHLAYVIYTSGSTGTPKGVMVEHRGLNNLICWHVDRFDLVLGCRCTVAANLSFDASGWELWPAIASGSMAILLSKSATNDVVKTVHWLVNEKASVKFMATALFNAAKDQVQSDSDLEYVLVGGDRLTNDVGQFVSGAKLVNNYGPTETTVVATSWQCPAGYAGDVVPIGRPIANTRIYILDGSGAPVPLGAVGELYIGGAGVARGYLNRPDLTAERFLKDPFSPAPGARMYRTGDLARYLPDGNIEFLGRNDDQVKIRGFRIEPGEIEARLAEHAAVREAAVVARGEGSAQRLVAYVVAAPEEDLAGSLRAHLSARLPDYMVPAAFVRLDALPLTPNGKLDRRALPDPDVDAYARQAYEPPREGIEAVLAGLWQELLGVERVGRHDSFFELGGHSLLAVRLLSRLPQALGVQLPLAALFGSPDLAGLAATIDGALVRSGPQALPSIEPVSRDAPLAPSFAQQRLWFLAQLDGVSATYHVPLALRLRGELDVPALQRSLDRILDRHEALRSLFSAPEGLPRVELLPSGTGLPLARHDLYGAADAEVQLERLCAQEVQSPFDLARGPLIRGCLIRLGEADHVFVLTQHHIVSDGWSAAVLLRELGSLYAAFSQGRPDPLAPLALQYPDYAAWQRRWLSGERLEAQAGYWRRVLADAPVLLALPTDRPRPAQQSFAGGSLPVRIEASLSRALKDLSRQHGVTLFMTVLAAWAAVLARLSGQDDLVIGTPTANRGRTETEGLIGFFVNTLALRLDLSGEPAVGEVLARVRRAALDAQDNQDLPFEQVVEIVQPPRRLDHTPLFQVMFAWQNTEEARLVLPGLEAEPAGLPYDVAKFDLELSLSESEDGIGGALGYATALFDAATVERHLGYLLTVLEAMVAEPALPVRRLDVLPRAERELLLETWNRTEAAYPSELCVHQLFEEQVRRSPDATALVQDEVSLSYGELNRRANRLAHHLIGLGVRPDERVAICLERSPAMVVGLLAILKAGGAYVPLDPAYPSERLGRILADAGPRLLLTDGVGRAVLGEACSGHTVLALDRPLPGEAGLPEGDPDPAELGLTAGHLAYVIYTSGSTGTPKGALNEHRAIVNCLFRTQQVYCLSQQDVVLQKTPFSFDVSVCEFFWTLLAGATLVLALPEEHKDPAALIRSINRRGVTTIHFVPSMLSVFLETEGAASCASLLRVICSGEALQAASLRKFCHLLPRAELHNLYGPTEAAIHVTSWRCPAGYAGDVVPIGRPIANTRIYILDGSGAPVPLGAVGELYIGGAGVARGYLNRPDLTAERFLKDPFSPAPGARMYRTGDLARYLPDGNIEFLGRNDDQVKIRGFRIEPGEIEARLAEHAAVREAAVVARGEGSAQRLVAYVVAAPEEDLAGSLRAHLSARLPDYMVPAAFVRLDALPLTPNGKLDRRALPDPDVDAYARQAYEPPREGIEAVLAGLWQELLGVERVGRHDSFFELGGHSLLAVRLLSRLPQALGVQLPLAALFGSPDLAGLAATIDGALVRSGPQALPSIEPVSRDAPLAPSFAQQRLWFLAQLDGVSATYHVPLALRLRGELDVPALQRSLDRILDRHEALRSLFSAPEGLPRVELLPSGTGLPLARHDLYGAADAEVQLERLCAQEVQSPFDLARGPLIRGCLIRLGEADHVFVLTQHHIVSDGWSAAVLLRELGSLYAAFSQGRPDPLAPLALQYPDYAAWQRRWLSGERLEAQAGYWRRVLADAPVLLALPTDRPRPAQQSFAGGSLPVRIEASLSRALKDLSRQHGVTLFMTVLAAWAAVLARLSGQDDLVIGTPTANRGRTETEGLIGFFVNTLALRLDLSGEPAVGEVLARVRRAALDAQDNQDLPFEQVVEIVQPPRRLDHTPLFQVMFAWQNTEEARLVLPGLEAEPAGLPYDVAKFDLELSLSESEDGIGGALGYATALFDAATVERHLGYLLTVLEAMVAEPALPVRRLDVLPRAERELLLETWNRTEAAYPSELCVHQLFEEQVRRSPDATALVQDEVSLSYGELNRRANRLAHHLIGLGVRPDERVAICLERSPAMVVGLLAILKAGGAYVPLDPAYPSERLGRILADAGPRLLLTDGVGRAVLGEACSGHTVLALDRPLPGEAGLPEGDPDPAELGLTAGHLAYVIYTSGSTGTPKGVMAHHTGCTNLYLHYARVFLRPGDRVLLVSSFSFDLTLKNIFSPLISSAVVVLAPPSSFAGSSLINLVHDTHSAVLNCAPSQFYVASGEAPTPPRKLRFVVLGGEQIKIDQLPVWAGIGKEVSIVNSYGPTEITDVAVDGIYSADNQNGIVPIGRPIANTRIYILDGSGAPVPLGAVGELYIGGAGVARGYLNRPDLTAERFLKDPFSPAPGARMYRTGDLARYLPDGNIEFLGRNDDQVKIRGFRIEPGEIEARLAEHAAVREAAVVARGEGSAQRLVAYVVAAPEEDLAGSLRAHLSARLPDYMVPAAFVRLDALPLTPNGKLDRRALPDPDVDAYARQAYEPPREGIEAVLAGLWQELLGVERVGRHDSFFELGGHSLLAVRLLSRLRQLGYAAEVRDLFASPTLEAFAAVQYQDGKVALPDYVIAAGTRVITPGMLPLIELTQADIERIVAGVPGGVGNVQDIYSLSPLQDGILFHHLLASDGDPYLQASQMAFPDRALLDRYLAAMQRVVDRHDILRTAFVWDQLSVPAQVVWRKAPLVVTEVELDPHGGPGPEQMARRFDPRHFRIDLTQAPLLRYAIAREPGTERWLVHELQHHLIVDHSTLEVSRAEVEAFLSGRGAELAPPRPYRDLIAQARLGIPQEEHERFFRSMLADIDEPTAPFGLLDVRRDGTAVQEARWDLPPGLNDQLRAQARRLGVSLASLCHLAWGQVIARTSGREQVVFGTVLFGRMRAGDGADQAMGLFINTLPLRLDLGDVDVETSVRQTHARLADLLRHEHGSLALAQRCSAVAAPTPLFSALLNYRHNVAAPAVEDRSHALAGIEWLGGEERTNYPFILSVEDYGHALGLTAQVVQPLSPDRVCALMRRSLESLVEALEHAPTTPVRRLDVLPRAERELLLETWNRTEAAYPSELCVHQLFEEQVRRNPDATALVQDEVSLSYGELNRRANRLAHHLIGLGVRPDERVAICLERSPAMVVGLLAILKAGGAYVPLDPAYPSERLGRILADAGPRLLLTDGVGRAVLGEACSGHTVLALDRPLPGEAGLPEGDPDPAELGLTAGHLAYVIYTSGSTGTPKGVMIEHAQIINLVYWSYKEYSFSESESVLFSTSINFDLSVYEMFYPLSFGTKLIVADNIMSKKTFIDDISLINTVPSSLNNALMASEDLIKARCVNLCGEPLSQELIKEIFNRGEVSSISNIYGPTETTVYSTWRKIHRNSKRINNIGRPIANTRIYILDGSGAPVPLGAVGELYIGGAGVARGYLNRPDLTAERFLKDPFSPAPGARMYRTGDLARYLPDGNIEFLGRNDDQVKIRGFRIEPGEIEARLAEHAAVREAAVVARGEGSAQRLVAYVVAAPEEDLAGSLRAHLSARLPDYMVPAAFVRLDALPLTPNGKLDRRALPDPDVDAYARQAYEPPREGIEAVLAGLWQELLGVERVGRHDSFFELGGHSLLAVRLLSRLRQLGYASALSVNQIFQNPKLQDLAVVLQGNQLAEGSIVEIRKGKSDIVLFALPTGHGDISYVHELSKFLSDKISIYAIIWPNSLSAFRDLNQLAEQICESMRSVQKNGPYRLLGYSSGGLLACAIAQQLANTDENVSFVGLIDTAILRGRSTRKSDISKNILSNMLRRDALNNEKLRLECLAGELSATSEYIPELFGSHENFDKIVYNCYLYSELCSRYEPTVGRYNILHIIASSSDLENEISVSATESWRKNEMWHRMKIVPFDANHESIIEERGNRKKLGHLLSEEIVSN